GPRSPDSGPFFIGGRKAPAQESCRARPCRSSQTRLPIGAGHPRWAGSRPRERSLSDASFGKLARRDSFVVRWQHDQARRTERNAVEGNGSAPSHCTRVSLRSGRSQLRGSCYRKPWRQAIGTRSIALHARTRFVGYAPACAWVDHSRRYIASERVPYRSTRPPAHGLHVSVAARALHWTALHRVPVRSDVIEAKQPSPAQVHPWARRG